VAIKDLLLPEYDHEMAVTRRLLERAPEAEFAWKPHEKSWPLGSLAAHLANLPRWTSALLEHAEFDMADAAAIPRGTMPASRIELLERFDANVAAARKLIDTRSDQDWLSMWTFKNAGETMFTMPRVAALRSFVMNHSVHHRGQFSVYLRLRDVPVPAMYGPSADEG
jgi:uncharacterized damage-inducible protein DinB